MPVSQEERVAPSPELVEQRVAILRKLRENLLQQRERFRHYLQVLESEGDAILEDDTEKLEAHVNLEASIVSEIFAFQKVIVPLEDLYRANLPQGKDEIPALKESLDVLKERVQERNKKNQDLLRRRMAEVRVEIAEIRNRRRRRPAFTTDPTPTLIDIKT